MYSRHSHRKGIVPTKFTSPISSPSLSSSLFSLSSSTKCSTILLIIVTFILVYVPSISYAIVPKYETAYACEGKTLTIECEAGDLINLIRANYGRFSITICNDHGNVDWSVNCMSPKSLRVLHSKCAHKQNCSVLASTNMFGDPCPGTHKYLEAHYQCISAAQTSTTTNRPSPPWLITSQPSVWSTSTVRNPTTSRIAEPLQDDGSEGESKSSGGILNQKNYTNHDNSPTAVTVNIVNKTSSTTQPSSSSTVSVTSSSSANGDINNNKNSSTAAPNDNFSGTIPIISTPISSGSEDGYISSVTISSTTSIGHGRGSSIYENAISSSAGNTAQSVEDSNNNIDYSTQSTILINSSNNNKNRNIINNNYFCGPTTARNLFWNHTKVGEVNVQSCPGGATGIAKWRCIFVYQYQQQQFPSTTDKHLGNNNSNKNNNIDISIISSNNSINGGINSQIYKDNNNNNNNINSNKNNNSNNKNYETMWQPSSPDLTQCRSLWLNSLEIRVNQRDSSLISIANDLSQVTSSKTLYGGDMLVTTKIIQTMSEKMAYDIETFPDQRQREAIVYELLHGVIKTGSNLLDASQHLSWLDLSHEDQMRVATSLLTGLEDNAFLLADTIIREKNVVQKVKNILLSVRILETRNIIGNEIFPDSTVEQWHVSDDKIELPRGALIENSEGGLVRIVFVAFDRLESILRPTNGYIISPQHISSSSSLSSSLSTSTTSSLSSMKSGLTGKNGNQSFIIKNRVLNSKVISASLGKGRHIQLSQPIRLTLKHLKTENVTSPTCVFWNYIDHAWSGDGCYTETTNKTHTICMCSHLTNFAILMDIVDEINNSLISVLDVNIRLFIYISIALCVTFIIIAIVLLKIHNGIVLKTNRKLIYKNLYMCLLVIEILFLIGIAQSPGDGSEIICGFTSAFIHVFFISTVAWICFEGFQLHLLLMIDETLLEVKHFSKIIWYYILSYGLSLIIIAISSSFDTTTYTNSDYCVWMETNNWFYITFLVPLIIFILIYIIYSIMAYYKILKKYNMSLKNKEHTRLASIRFYLRCSFIFLIIFITNWSFIYLYIRGVKTNNDNSYFYGYLFVFSNTLQGAYILLFNCLQNEKFSCECRKCIRQQGWIPKCMRCSNISFSSTQSINNQRQIDNGNNIMQNSLQNSGTNIIENAASGTMKKGLSHQSRHFHYHLHGCGTDAGIGGVSGVSDMKNTTATDSGIYGGHLKRNLKQEQLVNDGLSQGCNTETSTTSSAGSTQVIYNGRNTIQPDMLHEWNCQYQDDQYEQQQQKKRKSKNQSSLSSQTSSTMRPQEEEFYWTEKNTKKKKDVQKRNKTDTLHTVYPSYKKQMSSHNYPQSHSGDNLRLPHTSYMDSVTMAGDGVSVGGFVDIKNHTHGLGSSTMDPQQLHQHRYITQQKQQQYNQMPSADIVTSSSAGGILDFNDINIDVFDHHQQQQQQKMHQFYHSRHNYLQKSNDCLQNYTSTGLNRNCYGYRQYQYQTALRDIGVNNYDASGGVVFGNSDTGSDEPIYEEIVNGKGATVNRNSDIRNINCGLNITDDDIGEDDDPEEDNDDGNFLNNDNYSNRNKGNNLNNTENQLRCGTSNRTLLQTSYEFGDFQGHDDAIRHSHHHLPLVQQPQQQQQLQQQQQQQQIGRNLSAMLDENNTVICYLEPLPK